MKGFTVVNYRLVGNLQESTGLHNGMVYPERDSLSFSTLSRVSILHPSFIEAT